MAADTSPSMNPDLIKLGSAAQALGGALGVGLLVGLERGWRDRDLPEGGRVAGLRTFGVCPEFCVNGSDFN